MTRAQEVALDLFESRGFDAVTVEEIARAADVGPASLYRNFGTKEQLVLWDPYDPLLFAAVARHLERQPPLRAVRDGVIEAIASVYDADKKRVLRRAEIIANAPTVRAASREGLTALREGLAQVLAPKVKDALERELLAAVFTSTLEIAVERWRLRRGREPLAALVRQAFQLVARLS